MKTIQLGSTGLAAAAFSALAIFADVACAQTVQLPSFHLNTTNTTVSVPDQGDAFLGGIGRSSSSRVERGAPGGRGLSNVATGGTNSAGSTRVSAQIHDLDSMDQALLNSGGANDGLASGGSRIGLNSSQLAATKVPNAISSVAELRRQTAMVSPAQLAEGTADLDRGRELLTQGKAAVAKIYLQNAARQGSDEIRKQALAELQKFNSATGARQIAGR
jgi:hypothetical protein